MAKNTLEEIFSAAMLFAEKEHGRGFQAKISKLAGVDSSNLNSIIKAGKGTREAVRRRIVEAVITLNKDFPAKRYDDFLDLGSWILAGKNPENWEAPNRAAGEMTLPKPTISGTASSTPPEPPNVAPAPPNRRQLNLVPLISWVQAGGWKEVADPFQPGDADEWLDTTATRSEHAFALSVRGDSMEPEFTEGDIIIVDPEREPVSGSYIIAKNGAEATFKQFVMDGQSVFLKPLNSRYPIRDMTGIEFKIVGVVVEKRKRY
jgi:SOS-response transcriptional repressor LexA